MQSSMKCRIAWEAAGNCKGEGNPIFSSQEEAQEVADALNREWPTLRHWVIPVAEGPAFECQDCQDTGVGAGGEDCRCLRARIDERPNDGGQDKTRNDKITLAVTYEVKVSQDEAMILVPEGTGGVYRPGKLRPDHSMFRAAAGVLFAQGAIVAVDRPATPTERKQRRREEAIDRMED